MTSPEAKDTLREKHLAMIRSVISRMAGNSFEVRKWSVGIVAAALGLSADKTEWRLVLLGAFAAAVFWYLDAFFLYQEQRFRTLFEGIRWATVAQLEANPYFLGPDYQTGADAFPPAEGVNLPAEESLLSTAFRDGVSQFHHAIVVMLGTVAFLHK